MEEVDRPFIFGADSLRLHEAFKFCTFTDYLHISDYLIRETALKLTKLIPYCTQKEVFYANA